MSFNPNEHMMKLKGKDYLQVAWRLVWFRDDHPDWSLNADIVEQDQEHAIFKAVICDENGIQKSSGHGSESKRDFGDFLEKAETKAIGRALAMLGYGTQFAADELDELPHEMIELADEFSAAGARLEMELLENEYGDNGFDSEMEYAEGLFDRERMEAFHDLYIEILEGLILRKEDQDPR